MLGGLWAQLPCDPPRALPGRRTPVAPKAARERGCFERRQGLAEPSFQRVGPLPQVHRTVAITCGAHIDEARGVVEHLQIQRADWCIALFCGLQHYPRPCLATKTLLGLSTLPGLASRDLTNRCHAA